MIAGVANMALDPLLMFAPFGLGVRGAALATSASQAVACALLLRALASRRQGTTTLEGGVREVSNVRGAPPSADGGRHCVTFGTRRDLTSHT